MANRLMTCLADAEQVALLATILIHVPDIQGQIRPALDMVDMMHHHGFAKPPVALANLAFMAIKPKHVS